MLLMRRERKHVGQILISSTIEICVNLPRQQKYLPKHLGIKEFWLNMLTKLTYVDAKKVQEATAKYQAVENP